MRHVIVGGAGLVGTALVEQLIQDDASVVVADIRRPSTAGSLADYWPIDVTDRHAVRTLRLEPDDVVHVLASRQYADPVPRLRIREWFDEVIVDGLEAILDRAVSVGCRKLTYFSTDMVYGRPRRSPVDEDHPLNPISHYSRSKTRAEAICERYRERGVDITIFRPRLIVGAGRLGVLSKMFRIVRAGWPLPLIGSGTNRYQMVAVDDCASAIRLAVARQVPSRTYNLGSDAPPTVHELLTTLVREVGSRSHLVRTPAGLVKDTLRALERCRVPILYGDQYEIADVDYVVSTERAAQELGWRPRYGDADMLRQAYEHFFRTG